MAAHSASVQTWPLTVGLTISFIKTDADTSNHAQIDIRRHCHKVRLLLTEEVLRVEEGLADACHDLVAISDLGGFVAPLAGELEQGLLAVKGVLEEDLRPTTRELEC